MYADVVMIIADVSGYTRFMVANETELEHSQEIISALLEAIISEVQIPLSIAKLEGDAIFLYAIKDGGTPERIRGRLSRFFAVFASRLAELAAGRRCQPKQPRAIFISIFRSSACRLSVTTRLAPSK